MLSSDGKLLANAVVNATVYNNVRTLVWDIATGKLISVVDGKNPVAFSPDSRYLLTWSHGGWAMWDTQQGKLLYRVSDKGTDIRKAQFSPDGRTIYILIDPAADLEPNPLKAWDVATGRPLTAPFLNQKIYIFAFSQDGNLIATIDSVQSIAVYNTVTGEVVGGVAGVDTTQTVAISPNGRYVISGGFYNNSLWLLDMQDPPPYRTPRRLVAHHYYPGPEVLFSPDSKHVLTSAEDGTRLWTLDFDTQLISPLSPEYQNLVPATQTSTKILSPDGKYELDLSGSGYVANNGIILKDAHTGAFLYHFKNLGLTDKEDRHVIAAFSPDGKYIVSGRGEKAIAFPFWQGLNKPVWKITTNDLLDYACKHVYRELTQYERQKYGIFDTSPTCPDLPVKISYSSDKGPLPTPTEQA
ncbi:MAG: WD40 repeat domain-containing protein [Chloroflexota bacterium]